MIAWLFNAMSKEIVSSVMYSSTASEIWHDLRDRFLHKNRSLIFQLRLQLMSLHQGADSASVYYTKLNSIWEELMTYKPVVNCVCRSIQLLLAYLDVEYVMSFFMGLHDSFS